jgi:hypothetical protein
MGVEVGSVLVERVVLAFVFVTISPHDGKSGKTQTPVFGSRSIVSDGQRHSRCPGSVLKSSAQRRVVQDVVEHNPVNITRSMPKLTTNGICSVGGTDDTTSSGSLGWALLSKKAWKFNDLTGPSTRPHCGRI